MKKIIFGVYICIAFLGMLSCNSDKELPSPALQTEKQLLSFNFLLSENPIGVNVIGDINEATHTVFVILPGNTLKNALYPDIMVSPGASYDPMGVTSFNSSVTITITAEDGSTQNYEVKVVNEKEALVAIHYANPGNALGWDIYEQDLGLWEGVTLRNGAVVDLLIHNAGLTVIPEEIGYFRNLEDLGMHMNDFANLPEEIGKLKNLKRLSVGINDELSFVPTSIGDLENLKVLHLNNNSSLTSLPGEIGNLINLQRLFINGNGFSIIPAEICALESNYGTFIFKDVDAACE